MVELKKVSNADRIGKWCPVVAIYGDRFDEHLSDRNQIQLNCVLWGYFMTHAGEGNGLQFNVLFQQRATILIISRSLTAAVSPFEATAAASPKSLSGQIRDLFTIKVVATK